MIKLYLTELNLYIKYYLKVNSQQNTVSNFDPEKALMSAKTATGSIKELARNSIEFVFLTYIFNNKKHIKLQPFLADAQRSVLIPEITH